MKIYKLINYCFLILLLVGFNSCTKDFDELNTNSNTANEQNITSINPLIGHVQRHIFAPDRYSSWRGNLIFAGRAAEQFSFGFAGTWFPDGAGLDGTNSGWNDASWDQPIDRNIGTLDKLLDLTASDGSFSSSEANAVVIIMKSFLIQRITDQYGDMPYSELGSESFPSYDSQAEIYSGIINELKGAISTLNSSSASTIDLISDGDLMYGGDIAKWTAAANTLRLRMAIRSHDAAQNGAIIDECLGEKFIAQNSDNVQLAQDPTQSDPVSNSWYGIWNTWLNTETGTTPAGWVLCKTLINQLKADNDPRLYYFAQPKPGSPAGDPDSYEGSEVAALSSTYVNTSELSLPTSAMLNDVNFPIIEMTYAEAELLQAEARLIKGNLAAAQMHYENGISASMEQWGAIASEISDFFSNSSAASLDNNPEIASNQIGIQRWLAAYTNGREAWSVMRRFGGLGIYPDKTFGNGVWASTSGTVGSANKLPQRLNYPQSEKVLNSANVQSALDRQGEDVMTTTLWWAK